MAYQLNKRHKTTTTGFSVTFWRVVAFVLFCVLPLSYHSAAKCDAPNNEPSEAITAVDSGMQSTRVRLLSQWINITLDADALSNFPVVRGNHVEVIDIEMEILSNQSVRFGMELLGNEEIDKIDEIIHNNPETANMRIILLWFKGRGKTPVTCRTLVNALHKTGINELGKEIEATCDVLKILDVDYKPMKVKKYSLLLSEWYGRKPVIDSTLWLPKRLQGCNITFVDLELKEEGRDVSLFDLVHDIRSGTRILFLGRPGVGKTTMTRHLSKTLIHVEQFYLVIKLHIGVASTIDSLETLLEASLCQAGACKYFDPDEVHLISRFMSKKLGGGVCFLIDGFDEYDGSGYVATLVRGDVLPEAVVLVTSRPSAAEDIKDSFHRVIEIAGFGEKSIKTYLKQLELSEESNQTIFKYLNAHPNVRQLCYLPLHLSMLVYVAVVTGDSNNALSLVYTETRLYSDFLSLTIKQYEPVKHQQTVKSLKECFDDSERETVLCLLLRKFGENAFEGVISGKQAFNSSSFDGLPESLNISSQIEALSLFKVEPFFDNRGNTLHKYYYSHPTFQEYLAAFHLTTIPREKQLKYIKNHRTNEVYKFYLGLIGSELPQKFDTETVFWTFVRYAREDLATYQDQELHIMKCAHEVGQGSMFTALLKAAGVITSSNSVQVSVSYDHDCWYVGYTLAQSPLYELTIYNHGDLALCMSFITNYLKHDPEVFARVNVTKLILGSLYHGFWPWFTERESPASGTEVLKFVPAFQNDVTHLELAFLRLEHGASVSRFGETLAKFRKLEYLALSVNVSVLSEGYLVSALKGLNHLKHLELGVINKHDDDTPIPGDLLELKGLKELQGLTLDISWNKDIIDVNATALIGGLSHVTGLQNLTIQMTLYDGFRQNGATELLQGIERISISYLNLHLDLCWEGLGNVSIGELAAMLRGLNETLKNLTLCIDFNFSGLPGHGALVQLMTEGLKGLTELDELSLELRWELQENEAIDEAAVAIVNGLGHLDSLRVLELTLQQNGSCSEIASLFESLTQLQELKLKWKSFSGKTNVSNLIGGLKHLKQLRKLDLAWNAMEDDDMTPLVESLKGMKEHLQILDLSNNNIGDAGMQKLAEVVHDLSSLEVLLLDQNKFSSAGAESVSQNVVKLSELHTLDFGLSLGAYSARALVRIQQNKAIPDTVLWNRSFQDKAMLNDSSHEPCDLLSHHLGTLFAIGVSVLLGGFLIWFAYASPTNKTIRKVDNQIPAASLAQGIFSASFAWDLDDLRDQGLDGTGTVIAILDTDIDHSCPSFLRKNIPVIDCLPHLPVASNEHGTVCASVAVGNSYQSTLPTAVPCGVAPGADLIMYRIAEGGYCYNEAVLIALEDIKQKNDHDVKIGIVSISYRFKKDRHLEEIHRRINALTDQRVVFVASVGNLGYWQARAYYPARFQDSVISVGSTDKDGRISSFTARGRIDVLAPGENITIPSSATVFQGTSFATPAISGLVSLLKQCANRADGSFASDNIHRVEILRHIFADHMTVWSDSGERLFYPVEFLEELWDDPNILNRVIGQYQGIPMQQN